MLYARLDGPSGENTKHNIRNEVKALEWAHNTLCDLGDCSELKVTPYQEEVIESPPM